LSFVDMPRTAIASFYFTDLFAEFGFGMIIAALVVKGRRASSWLAGSAVLVGLLAFVGSGTVLPTDLPHALMYGLPAALIVFGAVNLEVNGIVLPAHWVDRLGDASYSLYLVHEMVLSAGRQGWSRFMPAPLADNLWLFVFACVIALCAAGLLCWRYLEMPLTRFARACFAPPARVRPALAAE
jgi:exopolysaccharide production protein ExoZ